MVRFCFIEFTLENIYIYFDPQAPEVRYRNPICPSQSLWEELKYWVILQAVCYCFRDVNRNNEQIVIKMCYFARSRWALTLFLASPAKWHHQWGTLPTTNVVGSLHGTIIFRCKFLHFERCLRTWRGARSWRLILCWLQLFPCWHWNNFCEYLYRRTMIQRVYTLFTHP